MRSAFALSEKTPTCTRYKGAADGVDSEGAGAGGGCEGDAVAGAGVIVVAGAGAWAVAGLGSLPTTGGLTLVWVDGTDV